MLSLVEAFIRFVISLWMGWDGKESSEPMAVYERD